MPVLSPGLPPPFKSQSKSTSMGRNSKVASSGASISRAVAQTSRFPRVILDQDIITDVMAARLTASLLGHVLFLKSQVPFPVMQLARMPGSQKNTRAFKKCSELLTSFDTLSSHLVTTFSALSTAISRSEPNKLLVDGSAGRTTKVDRVYLAMALGPSIGTAKTKVMLAVDGLEIKMWGERFDDDSAIRRTYVANASKTDNDDKDTDDGDDEDGSDADGSEEEGSDAESAPESDTDEEETLADHVRSLSLPPRPTSVPAPARSPPLIRSPPRLTRAEEEQALRTADRLLSRTLASMSAGHGMGLTCEMSPTQTHVLIRAPRRFAHPAWTPKQNLTASLDGALREFLEEAGVGGEVVRGRSDMKKGKGRPVEGVWLQSRDGASVGSGVRARVARRQDSGGSADKGKDVEDEDGEMIWWSWDGKIVGFADW